MSRIDEPSAIRERGVIGALCRAHDVVTRASFQLAVACLAVIVVSFCYEVVARYAFNAPTTWANPLVSYLLCAMIFLALPEMTRERSHIAISILIDAMPAGIARMMRAFVMVVGSTACLLGAWITGTETGAQYAGGIWTVSFLPVPKWQISVFIPYGLLSAGLYFLRDLLGERRVVETVGAEV